MYVSTDSSRVESAASEVEVEIRSSASALKDDGITRTGSSQSLPSLSQAATAEGETRERSDTSRVKERRAWHRHMLLCVEGEEV